MEELIDIEAEWQKLGRQDLSETDRIQAQMAFLEGLILNQPQMCIKLVEEAIEASRQSDYEQGIAYGMALKGFALYMLSDHESALPLLVESLSILEQYNSPLIEGKVTGALASVHISMGNFGEAFEYGQRTLELMEKAGDREQEGWVLQGFGTGYEEMGQLDQALLYYNKSLALFKEISHDVGIGRALTGIGTIYQKQNNYEQAAPIHEESLKLFRANDNAIGEARALNDLGTVALHHGDLDRALALHQQSLEIRIQIGNRQSQSTSLHNLGKTYIASGDFEQAIAHLHKALDVAKEVNARTHAYQIQHTLSEAYEKAGDLKAALHHYRCYHQEKSELFSQELNVRLATMRSAHKIENAENKAEIARLKNIELREKNDQLQKLLKELKSAQAQLIQAEKLASLGQLTAGIAHELKNPLNFVTNFAALSVELMEELEAELATDDAPSKDAPPKEDHQPDHEIVAELLTDLRFNTAKVREHGQRADNIVRSMLEHARGNAGTKQDTDLNVLLRDYVKLAYHGMRATDREFMVVIKESYVDEMPQIMAYPQDLGRVFLNILNNAFYTVREKHRKNIAGYMPRVSISTMLTDNHINIRLEDNGEGIPDEYRKKIFEPFFTSKPTGSGTGLGLFMSYEIIVQGHRGELLVETETGKGSTFIINLPLEKED